MLGAGIHPARNDNRPGMLTNTLASVARRRAENSYSTLRVRQTVHKLFESLFRLWSLLPFSHCSLARTSPPAPPPALHARIRSIHVVQPGGVRLSHIIEGAQALVPAPNVQVSRNRFRRRIGRFNIKMVERGEDGVNALACEKSAVILGVIAQGDSKVGVVPRPVSRFRDASKLRKDRSGLCQ